MASTWPLTLRTIVVSAVVGLGSGVLATALTAAYLSDYATQLGELTAPLRLSEVRPRLPVPATVSSELRETIFPLSVQFYLSSTPTTEDMFNAARADRQGVVLTSDGWLATLAPAVGKPVPAFAVIGRRAYAVQTTVMDPFSGTLFLKIAAAHLAAAPFGSGFAFAPGDEAFAVDTRESVRAVRVVRVSRKALQSSEHPSRQIDTDVHPAVFSTGAPVFTADHSWIGFLAADGSLVPIEQILPGFRSLLKDGRVTRAALGLTYLDWSQIVAAPGTEPATGLLVTSVGKGSVAARAGLRSGDVITALADRTFGAGYALDEALVDYTSGQSILFTIVRQGQVQQVKVVLL